jgi:hypothetical protein
MVRQCEGKNLDPDLEQKEKQKNLERLAGQPIQIWNKKQKRGLVNDLDSLQNELWNTILAKKRKKHTQK